jgi:hypothetical protein
MRFEFQKGRFQYSNKIWALIFHVAVWIPVKSGGSLPFTIKQRGIRFSLSLPWSKK